MSKKLTTDADLTAVANAIRTKGGTSALLEYPNDFISAISAIETDSSYDVEDAIITRTISETYENSRITDIGRYAFAYCSNLITVSFPKCINIDAYAFTHCYSLTTASFPACSNIANYAFANCNRLISLYLTGSSYVTLANSAVFTSTPIGGYSTWAGRYGSIYVLISMLAAYKRRSYWSYFSSRMVGI